MRTYCVRTLYWTPLLLLLISACGRTEANLPAPSAEPSKPVPVSVIVAEERRVPTTLDVTGTLMPDAQTEIGADIEQRTIEVPIERGQYVTAGQVLARQDAEDAKNVLHEAEAIEAQIRERLGLTDGQPFDALKTPETQQARASMERAEADYQRFAQLVNDGAISRSEHDLRRADYLAAKAQYETTVNQMRQLYQSLLAQKVRVAMARKTLEDTVVRAPFSGIIAEKYVNIGRVMKKGDRIATLVRIDPLRIELTIPEGAVTAIRQGQKVSFSVQSYPDRTFTGTIQYIGPALKADARTLVVEAIVPNPSRLLQPGLFATAQIELPAARPVVVLPAAAVRNEGGISKVFVVRQNKAEARIVQLGREVPGQQIEILRGIAPGERIVKPIPAELSDGSPVESRS
jgi:RND family efflux transporter MFP subunit